MGARLGIASMDAHQLSYTRRTRGGGGEQEEEEAGGVKSEKVYSTATSRISGRLGVNNCSSRL